MTFIVTNLFPCNDFYCNEILLKQAFTSCHVFTRNKDFILLTK